MKVMRWILAFISLLGVLGQLGSIGTTGVNQSGVLVIMLFWLTILIVVIYYERKANGKLTKLDEAASQKLKEGNSRTISTGKGLLIALGVALAILVLGGMIIDIGEATYKPLGQTLDVEKQSPIVEQKPVEPILDAQEILRLVNEERAKIGVRPLVENSRLVESAKEKCLDMQVNNYFAHEDKNGVQGTDIAKRWLSSSTRWGENLIYGAGESSQDFVRQWYESSDHKKNMLNEAFVNTGIFICTDDPAWTRPTDGHYGVLHLAN